MSFFSVGQGRLKEVSGSIIDTQNSGLRFILNVQNDECNLEYPLLDDLSKKWKNVNNDLKSWKIDQAKHKQGNIRTLSVQSDTWIVSMLCQDKDKKTNKKSLDKCVKEIADLAKYEQASIHLSKKLLDSVPELKDMIDECFIKKSISVYIYKD